MLNNNLIRTYSDNGYVLLQEQTGLIYEEAVDAFPSKYTYKEVKNDADEAFYLSRDAAMLELLEELNNE